MTAIEIDAPPTALAKTELYALHRCEAIIRNGLQTYIEVGNALLEIRDQRLYRATHQTFDSYCDERWKMSRARAYQLIDASEVAADLSTIVDTGDIPESHLRPLAKLPPADRPAAFKRADQLAGDGPRTAAHVTQAAAEIGAPDLPIDYSIIQRRLATHGVALTAKHGDYTLPDRVVCFTRMPEWSQVLDVLSLLEDGMEDAPALAPIPPTPLDRLDAALPKALSDAGYFWQSATPPTIRHNGGWAADAPTVDLALAQAYDREKARTPLAAHKQITLAFTPHECAALIKEARSFERSGHTRNYPTISQALILLIAGIRGGQA